MQNWLYTEETINITAEKETIHKKNLYVLWNEQFWHFVLVNIYYFDEKIDYIISQCNLNNL